MRRQRAMVEKCTENVNRCTELINRCTEMIDQAGNLRLKPA